MQHLGPEAVCDRCLRPFGDDLDGIRRHLETEASTLATKEANFRATLSERQAEGERQRTKVEETGARASSSSA
jgi:hypothetical protein